MADQDVSGEIFVGGQRATTKTFLDEMGRPIQYALVRGVEGWSHGLSYLCQYTGTLYATELVPYNGTPPSNAIAPEVLTAADKKRAGGSDDEVDWENPVINRFISRFGLWQRNNESDLQFVYRVHVAIGNLGRGAAQHIDTSPDRLASRYAQQALDTEHFSGDCGATATLTPAVLRANKFLAEPLLGRHPWEQGRDPATGNLWINDHAKYRVYVQGIGWIVADNSDIAFGSANGEREYLKTFMVDPGNFITKHLGGGSFHLTIPALSPSALPNYLWFQQPQHPSFGSGNYNSPWQIQRNWHATSRPVALNTSTADGH